MFKQLCSYRVSGAKWNWNARLPPAQRTQFYYNQFEEPAGMLAREGAEPKVLTLRTEAPLSIIHHRTQWAAFRGPAALHLDKSRQCRFKTARVTWFCQVVKVRNAQHSNLCHTLKPFKFPHGCLIWQNVCEDKPAYVELTGHHQRRTTGK